MRLPPTEVDFSLTTPMETRYLGQTDREVSSLVSLRGDTTDSLSIEVWSLFRDQRTGRRIPGTVRNQGSLEPPFLRFSRSVGQ